MRVKFTIQKFNPEQDTTPSFKDYFVETGRRSTVLDALIRLKNDAQDLLNAIADAEAAIRSADLKAADRDLAAS